MGPLPPEERAELEAEIDALVAHAYGLTRDAARGDLRRLRRGGRARVLSAIGAALTTTPQRCPCEARVHRQPRRADARRGAAQLAADPGCAQAELDIASGYFNLAGFLEAASWSSRVRVSGFCSAPSPSRRSLRAPRADGGPIGLESRQGLADLERQLDAERDRLPFSRETAEDVLRLARYSSATRSRSAATCSASCTARRTCSAAGRHRGLGQLHLRRPRAQPGAGARAVPAERVAMAEAWFDALWEEGEDYRERLIEILTAREAAGLDAARRLPAGAARALRRRTRAARRRGRRRIHARPAGRGHADRLSAPWVSAGAAGASSASTASSSATASGSASRSSARAARPLRQPGEGARAGHRPGGAARLVLGAPPRAGADRRRASSATSSSRADASSAATRTC